MHLNSELLFKKYAASYFKRGMKILEIGPDLSPSTYQKIIGNAAIQWETLDIASSERVTYTAKNEYEFPMASNTFDIVLSGQTIEHVRKIWVWIKELARVCKTGGAVITISPVSWPYHEAPVDCWRIYPEGMKALYEDAGLNIQLNRFETLEMPYYRKQIPGESSKPGKIKTALKKMLGWPMTCSFDTITIGTKN